VAGAGAGLAARLDLAPLRKEAAQAVNVFVIHIGKFFLAKGANLTPRNITVLATGARATTRRSAGAAGASAAIARPVAAAVRAGSAITATVRTGATIAATIGARSAIAPAIRTGGAIATTVCAGRGSGGSACICISHSISPVL